MDLNDKELRLKQILEKNIREGKVGTAIAITGSWGVGKTFFWNNFLEKGISNERINHLEKILNRKYAYISLFGIESLSDLKTQIYSNIENYHSSIEVPKWLKGLPSIFKDTRISGLGISAPAKLIDNLMFNQVRDAIICFDDFERMSNKLDIKDVMGLANQLKLERNCQIILILDESKTEDNNKEKYAEYKEKLIDETIKIISVEPLIRANTKDVDKKLVNLMMRFADELEIHNFRFFQKVINLYKQFRAQLPDEVAYSTKEIILVRILQGYFIEDYGIENGLKWEDFFKKDKQLPKALRSQKSEIIEQKENIKLKSFRKISLSFCREDLWVIEFKKWFEQSNDWNLDVINTLANSEQISEKNNEINDKFHHLLQDFWGLQAKGSFPQELYEITQKVIGLESLSNISFAIKLIETTQPNSKVQVKELEKLTLEWMKTQLIGNPRAFYGAESWGGLSTIFKEFIQNFELPSEYLPILIDAVFNRYIQSLLNNEDKKRLEKATKQEWEKLLFTEIPCDERFAKVNSSYIIKKILTESDSAEFIDSFRKSVTEIYEEKGKESEFYKHYMSYLISRLDN